MAFLRLRLLGAPRIELDGEHVHFARRRAMALGIYLAVTGRPHSRDALTTIFWPESDASAGRANLRRTLYTLGRAVGDDFVVTEDDQVRFHHNGNFWMDVERFRELVAECHHHDHSADVVCKACVPLLTQAADLYRDDFLAGFSLPDSPDFDRWQFFQAEQARSEMALVLELLARAHIDQGNYSQAIVYAQRRLAFDPLYEPAHRQLMQLYAWTEQPAAADRQFQLCTQLLAHEMGVPPSAETDALHRAIRAHTIQPPTRVELEPAIHTAPAGEDDIRVLTVVSLGLGSDEASAGIASRAVQIQQLLDASAGAAERFGGHVDRIIGEDVQMIFGRDQVHEDDAERAVRAAHEAVHAMTGGGIDVRTGLNTGMAYCRRTGDGQVTVVGNVVNLAMRLRNRAGNGEIVAGRNTYLATRGLAVYVPLVLDLPGTRAAVRAYRLERLRAHAVKERGIEGLQAEMVGRQRELAALQTALARTQAGDGQMVAVIGAAGVGKSRLIAEFRRSTTGLEKPTEEGTSLRNDGISTPDVIWLEGRCVEHAMESAYSPFVDMLRQHFAPHNGHANPGGGVPQSITQNIVDSLNSLAAAGHLRPVDIAEIGAVLGWLLSLRFDNHWDTYVQGLSADQRRQRALHALERYLTSLAHQQPIVAVLEDIHWADELSLALVARLLDVLPETSLMVVCVYRPEARQAQGDLVRLAQEKAPEQFTPLVLHALSPAQGRQMLASLLALEHLPQTVRADVLAKAQGNPLFLEEIVRSLIDRGAVYRRGVTWHGRADASLASVPETIQSVVLTRFEQLTATQKLVLRAASVFGRLFEASIVARMLPAAVDLSAELPALVSKDFVLQERTAPEAEYSFRHVLFRDAIYEDLPKPQQTELHAAAGLALETAYTEQQEPYVEEIARHYDLGEIADKAVAYLIRAGQKAQRAYLNDAAIGYFRRALERLDADKNVDAPRARLAALRGLGEVHAAQGDLVEAEPPLRTAMALAKEMRLAPAEQIRLYFPLCHLLRWLGHIERLRQLGQEGLAHLESEGDHLRDDDAVQDGLLTAEAVMLVTYLAMASYLTGRRREYHQLTGLVVDSLRQLAYSQQLAEAYGIAAWWYRDVKRVPEALAWIHSLEEQARQRNDLWTLGYLYTVPGYWLPEAIGDIQAIEENLGRGLEIASQIGDDVMRGYALTFLGLVRWGQGRLDEAEAMLNEGLTVHEHRGALHMRVLNRKGIGLVRLCFGDWASVTAVLERGLREAADIHYQVHGVQMSRMALAYAYRQLDRRDDAADLYRQVVQTDECDGDGQVWIAFALAGLEQTLADPAAFQAACRALAQGRPATDPLPLVQWWLEPIDKHLALLLDRAAPPISEPVLDDWTWTDQFGDCSHTIDGGIVEIRAPSFYRDLWFNNVSGPRLTCSVEGDFVVEAQCGAVGVHWPAMGGLVLWCDEENFVRVGWGAHGPGALDFMGCVKGQDMYLGRGSLPETDPVYLRLARVETQVHALCSVNGRDWLSIGHVAFRPKTSLQVGLFAAGMIQRWAYPAAYADGTAIRFAGIHVRPINRQGPKR